MKRVYYNKLIRDKIPENIAHVGSECETKKLDDKAFEQELLKKVGEEASALPVCSDKQELIRELADVLDVIAEIKHIKNITDKELLEASQKNFERKGGFAKKLFLVWSSDDQYQSNEKTS